MADKYPDDPLDALNFSIDDEDLNFSPLKTLDKEKAASLFGISDEPKKTEAPAADIGGFERVSRKSGGSGDWLGLRDPSPLDILNDDYIKPSSAKTTAPPRETPPRAKTADTPVSGDVVKKTFQPAPAVRKRPQILDDLFGDSSFIKEKDKPKTPMFGTNTDTNKPTPQPSKELTTDQNYMPSLSERRRLSDKKPPTPKMSDPSDWLMESKDKSTKQTDSSKDVSKTTHGTANPPVKRTVQRDSGLPSWLSSGFNDPPIAAPEPSLVEGRREMTTLPQPIHNQPIAQTPVEKQEPVKEVIKEPQYSAAQQSTPNQIIQNYAPPQPPTCVPIQLSGDVDPNLIQQLMEMHTQLGAAMNKHHQNLQSYMQAIVHEAQRVGITDRTKIPVSDDKNMDAESDKSEGEEEEGGKENIKKTKYKSMKDTKKQKLKRQEEEIHEMEIQISKLELQVAQLELKCTNIEEIKSIEIESLKKTHEFEISAWETRYGRAKENFGEIEKEYQEKIINLKKKIEEIELLNKERIETLQSERMSDLEKLGEFHRVALDQAASITLPHVSGFGAVRLPMKIMQKPEDETELAARESALLEKEKQVEILRQKLEMEKMELDEVREREKIKREEKEREIRRVTMEMQLKEEITTKEFERKKDQIDALQAQIEKMREDALKEQAELTREKLSLAAEKARLEAAMSLERTSESPQLQPLDMMKARLELEAALEAAKEAREAADRERRRHVELRKSVEETTWDQKDTEQQLAMRERHVSNMLKEAEAKRAEATAALDKTQTLNEELEMKQREIREHMKQIETKERVLSAERMEIAREKVELERKKTQLEVLLPELNQNEDLVVHGIRSSSSHKDYVDPKALIMRLKAERDLQHYITPIRNQNQRP